MKNFKNLNVWKKGIQLVIDIYKISKKFPREEIYGLTNQMRRSTVSIPSNIADGSGRISDRDFNRFLYFSLGSAFELETQIIIAYELKFLTDDEFKDLIDKVKEQQKMITGLQKRLKFYS